MKDFFKNNVVLTLLSAATFVGGYFFLRLAYHMIMNDTFVGMRVSHAIEDALRSLKKCSDCGGMSEDELCYICTDDGRDSSILCMVDRQTHQLSILPFAH